jgi:uncharacterized protein YaaW (UPF0174 family)
MPKNDRLFELLSLLSTEQLKSIRVDILQVRKEPHEVWSREYQIVKTSEAFRSAAGNSFANWWRKDHDFAWKQIVIDVADKLSDGYTPFAWTAYSLNDQTPVEVIEREVLDFFQERCKEWWNKLKPSQRAVVISELNENINGFAGLESILKQMHRKEFWTEQVLESVISKGIVLGLEANAASGALGLAGGSLLTSVGWFLEPVMNFWGR